MSTNRHEELLPSFARRETFFGTNNTDGGAEIAIAGVPLDIGRVVREGQTKNEGCQRNADPQTRQYFQRSGT